MSLYYIETKNGKLTAINPSQIEMIYVDRCSFQYPSDSMSQIEHVVSVRVRFSNGYEILLQDYKCNDPEEVDSLIKKANEYMSRIVEGINNFEVKLLYPDDAFRRIHGL